MPTTGIRRSPHHQRSEVGARPSSLGDSFVRIFYSISDCHSSVPTRRNQPPLSFCFRRFHDAMQQLVIIRALCVLLWFE